MSRSNDVNRVSNTFLQCPNHHRLPHRTKHGECTPVHCPAKPELASDYVENNKVKPAIQESSAAADLILSETVDLGAIEKVDVKVAREANAQKIDTLTKLTNAAARAASRKAFFKVPDFKDAAEAEAWSQARAAILLPDAIAELEYQLKLGDDTQRRDAARDFLDINGMRKREAGGSIGATIILNLGGKELPWAQKVVEKLVPSTVDGSTAPTKTEPTND